MREFLKGVCVVSILVGGVTAPVAWICEPASVLIWAFRIGGALLAIAGFAAFLVVHFRRDKAPDYLHDRVGQFFDRGGFCFAIATRTNERVCYLDVYFQNRYERPCVGQIALRLVKGQLGRVEFQIVSSEINCDAGAFGVARIPLPLPAAIQGKQLTFQIGAFSEYPGGKGRMLRYRDGAVIRTNSSFRNAFGTALTVAGALGGALVLSSPATVTINLPHRVAEHIPEQLITEIATFWRLGDLPLKEVA